jgi:hypothetical protein
MNTFNNSIYSASKILEFTFVDFPETIHELKTAIISNIGIEIKVPETLDSKGKILKPMLLEMIFISIGLAANDKGIPMNIATLTNNNIRQINVNLS